MTAQRRAAVLVDQVWVEKPFTEIVKGDTFRLFDNGREVIDQSDRWFWVAQTDAYMDAELEEWVIDIPDEIEEEIQ